MKTPLAIRADILSAYEQHVQARYVQPKTIERHIFCLKIFLDDLEADGKRNQFQSLSPTDIIEFTTKYAQKRGVDCRRHMHTMLRCFLNFAWQHQWINHDLSAAVPSIKIYRLSRAPQPIKEHTIKEILRSIDRTQEAGCRDFTIIQLLHIYGVRAIQLHDLTVADIDWENDAIRFPAAKFGHPITSPLLPEAGNAILDYLSNFRCYYPNQKQLFLTAVAPYKPLTAASICGAIRRRILNAKVTLDPGVKYGTHAFRYACATRMLKDNCSLKVLADALGHRHFDSVQIYNKLDTEALRSIALPWPEVLS